MENNESRTLAKHFPTKPKLKPKQRSQTKTAESKYWSSFKTHQHEQNLKSSIPSINFSPTKPTHFAMAHSASLSFFTAIYPNPLTHTATISSFRDLVSSSSFRYDGSLIAASDLSGLVQVFDFKTRKPLRRLESHSRPVRFVKYPVVFDKLHLVSGGDDAVVKYWDVASGAVVSDFLGHKDYVRCGDFSPVSSDMFVTGSYDHTLKLWDVRVEGAKNFVAEINHGNPIEDVMFLPSGGLVCTAGGNCVKIWDLIGGGKMVGCMESHNKTVTSLCLGKLPDKSESTEDESSGYRIMSVALDGYMKVFDYARMKVTHSMRFPAPLMSISVSSDCRTRVIGSSNGILYCGRRKSKDTVEKSDLGNLLGFGSVKEPRRQVLRPTHFRYFHRGQGEKPSEGDYVITKSKKVKLADHDKLLRKFHHKEALVSVLNHKNPENVVAVMEELVARRKLLSCVSNLEEDELGLLLGFLQKHSTMPRHSSLLMGLTRKVIEMRAEDIRASDSLKTYIRNLKRSVLEEIKIQESLQEIQGIISPLLRVAGRR